MMRHCLIVLLVLVLMPTVLLASNYMNYTGFVLDETPVLAESEVHPRIWFTKDAIPALRARPAADDHAALLWSRLLASPYLTREIPDPPAATADKSIVHQYYGDNSQQAMLNALMYIMTEDAEKAEHYRLRAVDALLRAYDGELYDINPANSSTAADEIYRGTWAQNYCSAYDWVQSTLDPETDGKIRASFRKEAAYIQANLYDWASRPHNHLSKPAWGLGSFAVTLSSEPEAKEWLALALRASNDNTRYFFSADGIYREGAHYYIFSLINFVPFLYHYRNASGVNGFEVFQPAFEWPVLIRNASGWMPNHEDAYIRPNPSQLAAAAYMDAPTRLHSSEPLGKVLQWNFRTTDYGPFDESLEETGFDYSGASWDYPLNIIEFLCYDPSIEAVAPDISPTVFLDGGQTAFRNRWADPGPGQRYLLFQGVAEADNHEQFEHLSFIIQAEGQMMASDAGYSRKSYGEPIRVEWYRTAEAHNVVTANGEAPGDPAENWTPPSFCRIDTDFFDFEEKRAMYASGGIHARGIAFAGGEYFIVADRVLLPEERDISMNLHGGRGSLVAEGGPWVWQYEEDRYGPAARFAAWVFAPDASFTVKKGEITYIKGDYAEFPYLDVSIRAIEQPMLQLLWPAGTADALPVVTDLSDELRLAFRVASGDWTDLVAMQLHPVMCRVENFESDATFLWQRSGRGHLALAAAEMTSFRAGEDMVLAFSAPVAVAAITRGSTIEMNLTTDSPVFVRYKNTNVTEAMRVLFEGAPLDSVVRGRTLEFHAPASGVYTVETWGNR